MAQVILTFCVAYGIVIGGTLLGGIGAFLTAFITAKPPFDVMYDLATQLKIMGLVGALGGTFDSFLQIEKLFVGNFTPVILQLIYIFAAFLGAHLGTISMQWLTQGSGV
ncbi:YtrH family sporulation protein [Brevibacillus daliensis]|uniref:YtrH family sporulation protein n=1 Tax=Brevibacillus daliensis TaxID=2892995 RepID=UPI001E598271|nr:YtrH family sporulation protein [Brevibacillus daliensis]